MQAGHAIEGRHNYILFDEEVIYAQCYSCNCGYGGKYGDYAITLIEKHGLDWYKEKKKYKVVQFTEKELLELKKSFKERADELWKQLRGQPKASSQTFTEL